MGALRLSAANTPQLMSSGRQWTGQDLQLSHDSEICAPHLWPSASHPCAYTTAPSAGQHCSSFPVRSAAPSILTNQMPNTMQLECGMRSQGHASCGQAAPCAAPGPCRQHPSLRDTTQGEPLPTVCHTRARSWISSTGDTGEAGTRTTCARHGRSVDSGGTWQRCYIGSPQGRPGSPVEPSRATAREHLSVLS